MAALIGPNGSGKTTTLRLISGVLHPERGGVRLRGRELLSLRRREIARETAVVPQILEVPYALSVREMVMLGRTPHVSPWRNPSAQDAAVVNAVMARVGIADLAERLFPDLSGGERQKAIIAMALAQEPRLLLLDEPTAHLDIHHQLAIMDTVFELQREQGLTVLAAMHDLNLASLYFDRLILLNQGRIVVDGPPQAVIREEVLREAFGARVRVRRHPLRDRPQVVLLPSDGAEAAAERRFAKA
ncbi:MAG: ABC transporter ATP-binding protein [Chloroflexi bacterium]|nr:ABC transporter ATP-binding protein [Chloroflexota bacterium]